MSDDQIMRLHKKINAMPFKELCVLYTSVYEDGGLPEMLRIIKIYMARSLAREGII